MKMATIKETITSIGEDMKKLESSNTARGNVHTLENSCEIT